MASHLKAASPYLPCIHAANELHPITISQMEMETHHRGKQTVIHVLAPPKRAVALVALVEDEEGSMALLQLYYQPSETVVPAEQILRRGSCYLLKEPFLTCATTGFPGLRGDHPGDIILLPHDHELVPAKWRKSELVVVGSRDLRMEGNDAVGKKNWAEAESLYTTAVRLAKTSEEAQLAYLNRSLTNLRLGRPATALADAIKSRGPGSLTTEKGLLREATALYELAKYDQCLDRLQTLRTAYPGSTSATPMIDRAQARLLEQSTGQYDFQRMYRQAKATPPLIDCATYTLPVEIRDSPGKGRGLFTKRKVLAGEMLICEKAFGYIYGGKDHPDSKDMTVVDVHADLRTQIVQRLFHNIEDARSFGDLHHGDYKTVPVYEVDGKPVVDICLVNKVIYFTNYRAARTSLTHFGEIISGDTQGIQTSSATTGVWSFISHINHSCVSNVRRSFIGDMQIVRATADLEEGTELLVWYYLPQRFESHDEAQTHPRQWGFACECALCLDRKAMPEKVLLKRESLSRELDQFMGAGSRAPNIPKAQLTLERLKETYSAAARQAGAVRLELWEPYSALGQFLNARGKPSEAIEMILRGLEALGFVISASPPRSVAKSSKTEFCIRQWGLANSFCVAAFHTLHLAYKTISPDNSSAAREYMETLYSMAVGEKASFLETYPDLG